MTDEDHNVLRAMEAYGGGFASALAEAAFRADASNFARLKAAFPDYWAEYAWVAVRARLRAEAQGRGGRG